MTEGFRPSIDFDHLVPPVATAPLSCTVTRAPQRHHRLLTVPAGWTLLVCLFLPALQFCDSMTPLPMASFPFLWFPYVFGVVIALAATARPHVARSRGRALFMLVRASALECGVLSVLELVEGGGGAKAVMAIFMAQLAFAVTWREPTERAVAAISVVAALFSFAFTMAIALQRYAVWGAFVGAITAGVLLAGTLGWWLEALVRPRATGASG